MLSIKKLKHIRQDKGWSQEVLAKASSLSIRTIQRIESKGKASAESVLAISAALEVSPTELQTTNDTIQASWSGEKLMKASITLIACIGAILTIMIFGGRIEHYIDGIALLFCISFLVITTILGFGVEGLVNSIKGFRYLFAEELVGGKPAQYLSSIYDKQIKSCYGGATIAFIIGLNAVIRHAHSQNSFTMDTLLALTINCLLYLYAVILAEGFLRPLKTKLETCDYSNE